MNSYLEINHVGGEITRNRFGRINAVINFALYLGFFAVYHQGPPPSNDENAHHHHPPP